MDLAKPFYMVRLVYNDSAKDPARENAPRLDTWVCFDDEFGNPTNVTQERSLADRVARRMREAHPNYRYQVHQFSHEVYHEDA